MTWIMRLFVRGATHSQSLWTRPALVRPATARVAGQLPAPSAWQSSRPPSFQMNYCSSRYLSNTANPQLEIMRKKVQAIVDRTPIGQNDVDTWLEAQLLLHWWASQRTSQSVKISFLLLERLVSEQQTHSTGDYNDISFFLNGNIVSALVGNK
jgi:hypothetical protein